MQCLYSLDIMHLNIEYHVICPILWNKPFLFVQRFSFRLSKMSSSAFTTRGERARPPSRPRLKHKFPQARLRRTTTINLS